MEFPETEVPIEPETFAAGFSEHLSFTKAAVYLANKIYFYKLYVWIFRLIIRR